MSSSSDSYTESVISTTYENSNVNECLCSDCKCNDCTCNNKAVPTSESCNCHPIDNDLEANECTCANCECNDCNDCNDCTESVGSADSTVEDTILRGKWIYDGSKSIDDMILRLQQESVLLEDLKRDGWYLVNEVSHDYACIRLGDI
jgi:hypothetical protein